MFRKVKKQIKKKFLESTLHTEVKSEETKETKSKKIKKVITKIGKK